MKPIASIDSTPCGGKAIRVDGRPLVPCAESVAEAVRQRVQEELDAAYEKGMRDAVGTGVECHTLWWAGSSDPDDRPMLCTYNRRFGVAVDPTDVGEVQADVFDMDEPRYEIRPARLIVGDKP